MDFSMHLHSIIFCSQQIVLSSAFSDILLNLLLRFILQLQVLVFEMATEESIFLTQMSPVCLHSMLFASFSFLQTLTIYNYCINNTL